MTLKPCTIDGCSKPVKSRGWCQMHWNRWHRNGDPNIVTRDWGHGKTARHVSYSGAHNRVLKAKGRAVDHQCTLCGGQAAHWAYDHTDPQAITELVPIRGVLTPLEYSLDPARYMPICQPCHRIFDGRQDPIRDEQGKWSS